MKKPRITVSLEPDAYLVLQRLSAANGESMSSIIASLVSSVAPSLSRVAEIVEAASSAQGDFLERLQKVTEEGEAYLSPLVMAGIEGLDEVTDRVLDAVRPPSL